MTGTPIHYRVFRWLLVAVVGVALAAAVLLVPWRELFVRFDAAVGGWLGPSHGPSGPAADDPRSTGAASDVITDVPDPGQIRERSLMRAVSSCTCS